MEYILTVQVIFEGGRAVGVQVVPTKHLSNGQPTPRIIRARKQIIISGGTLSSPLILQRSGIGDPEKLRKAGVKPLVDLPGVGLASPFPSYAVFFLLTKCAEFPGPLVSDGHLLGVWILTKTRLTFAPYRVKPHVETMDSFARGDSATQERVFQQWNINGTGPLATNGIDAGVKIRPTEDELEMMDKWPCKEFRSGWESYFKNKLDKPVMHYSAIAGVRFSLSELYLR